MGFRKTEPGRMGILTIPAGTMMFRRRDEKAERARHEFDVLAMPSLTGKGSQADPCYSFKMQDEFWYVLTEDIPNE
jgi:hypothetical protein